MSPPLLSHRLRGLSAHENSLSALGEARARGIPSFEVDTRVSADGQILVYHDGWLDTRTDRRGPVAAWDVRRQGRPLLRGLRPEPVPTLGELLHRVAGMSCEVLLDVKDYGAEEQHCALVREAGLQRRCWIVSWMPEVLLRVHAIAPELRLSFSYLPATRHRLALRCLGWLLGGDRAARLGRLAGRFGRDGWRGVSLYRDAERRLVLPSGPVRGGFPIHILSALPRGALGRALRRSGGGVGIDARLLTPGYARRVRAAGLKLFVFTLDTPGPVRRAQRLGVDRIYTDNPDLFRHPW